jgi:hypothetical protein
LHPLVILEALGGTPSKRHRLVTLGGCRLLDGSGVVSVELSKKSVEEPRRGSRLPRQSGKCDISGNEALSDFLSTWLKDQVVS